MQNGRWLVASDASPTRDGRYQAIVKENGWMLANDRRWSIGAQIARSSPLAKLFYASYIDFISW
jgi:hypothetical protein